MATTKSREKPAHVPKKVRTGRGGGPNKSAFIREQPATMSAKEVVEAAKSVGIALSEGFVYNVRSNSKGAAAKAPAKRGAGRREVAPQGDEAAFRLLVVQLGTEKAKALIDEVEGKLAAVIAGR